MNPIHVGDAEHSDSSSDSFSPVRQQRPLHHTTTLLKNPNNDSTLSSGSNPHAANDSLPALQDKSWIGARVSPIQSFDNDNDDDDDDDNENGFDDIKATEPYRKALNESLEASFLVATERSSLLGGNRMRGRGGGGGGIGIGGVGGFTTLHGNTRGVSGFVGDGNFSSLHPLWDDKDAIRALKLQQQGRNAINNQHWWFHGKAVTYWGTIVASSAGIMLACMGMHDAYIKYISYRRGVALTYSVSWTVPWLMPSGRTLIRFGAFCPSRLIELKEYWRVISSPFISTSFTEWIVLLLAWHSLRRGSNSMSSNGGILPTTSTTWSPMGSRSGSCGGAAAFLVWPLLYLFSVWTGQLWVTAFHPYNAISGCASWGTCGTLCAIGVSKPHRRFFLFMIAISLVMVDLAQPYTSAYGAIGGSFFGWAFYGVGLTPVCPIVNPGGKFRGEEEKNTSFCGNKQVWLNFVSVAVMLALWGLPLFYILRQGVF